MSFDLERACAFGLGDGESSRDLDGTCFDHDRLLNASIYDELLVVRPPKRLVGGLTVKF